MKFHHIGVVVNNIADNVKIIENALQSKKTSIPFHDKIQKVNVTFLDVGDFYIELLETSELRKKGGLIVCKPVLGFENRLVSFIFLESLPFKLIELFSKPQHNSNI